MGRGGGVVERRDPQPPVGVHTRGVGVDLGEAAEDTVVLQDGLDEEGVRVAHHLQITPATHTSRHQDPELQLPPVRIYRQCTLTLMPTPS
jgi:hypothetical protein